MYSVHEFIYVDSNRKWWIAEGELLGDNAIQILLELPEEFKRLWKKEFVDYINSSAPIIIMFNDEEKTMIIPAANRKIQMPP